MPFVFLFFFKVAPRKRKALTFFIFVCNILFSYLENIKEELHNNKNEKRIKTK